MMAIADPISESTTTSPPTPADLLVLVAAMLPEHLGALMKNMSSIFPPETALIATENPVPESTDAALRVISVPSTNTRLNLTPADFLRAWQLVQQYQPRAVLILGPGSESLAPAGMSRLANAVLAGSVDLALPCYKLPPHTGLANSAIFYPLSRALFATRERFPLTIDLAFSSRMAQRLAVLAQKSSVGDAAESPIWPASEAATAGFTIEEYDVGDRTFPQPAETDINALLTRMIGSLFADIESKAAFWQRARRVPPPRRLTGSKPASDGTSDLPRMVESYRFAYNNLLEIWTLVLSPHSLLGLKHLTALNAADFRMPDALWVRVVFEFLVAFRQRTINRGHLLGAMIPIYLAWVAGHINMVASGTDPESHIEALATAFESDKPYLVSRWRWPDRFNS